MIADFFWSVATSDIALGMIGLVLLATLIVGHLPVLSLMPAFAPWIVLARAASYVALTLLSLLIGFRLSDERAETQRLKTELQWSENQLEQQRATSQDKERLAREAQAVADAATRKVTDYEDVLAKLPAGDCALSDDDVKRLLDIAR